MFWAIEAAVEAQGAWVGTTPVQETKSESQADVAGSICGIKINVKDKIKSMTKLTKAIYA